MIHSSKHIVNPWCSEISLIRSTNDKKKGMKNEFRGLENVTVKNYSIVLRLKRDKLLTGDDR